MSISKEEFKNKINPREKLLQFLRENRDKAFSINEIAENLNMNIQSVHYYTRTSKEIEKKRIGRELYCTIK